MNVWDAIQTKRAVRHFTDEPLPQEALERILSAGRRSQSAKNTQPWHFIVIRDRAALQELSTYGHYLAHVTRAAACICIVTPQFTPGQMNWIAFDAGQCAAYMQLAAQEIGVGSVLGGIDSEQATRMLGVPDSMRIDALISFGYPAEAEQRPLKGQGRRPLDEIVHWERW